MKTTQPLVETRRVVRALRDLGFELTNKGHKHGHIFQRPDNVTARPNTMRREMTHQALYQLGNELEGKLVISRRDFIAMVKNQKKAPTTPEIAPSTLPDKDRPPVPPHVAAVREREWDVSGLLGEEVPMATETTRKRTRKAASGISAVQVNEASYEIVRISQFEVRVKAADGELDVLGQYASKKDAVAALTEFLMEQS